MSVCDTLNIRVGEVLASQEAEFLRAWRARVYDVQREVLALRAAASASAAALARDEKLHDLEKTRDWFRVEALRLDELTTTQAGELLSLRERLTALSDDAAWLEGRAKSATATEVRLRARVEELQEEVKGFTVGDAKYGGKASATIPSSPSTKVVTGASHIGIATLAALSPIRRTALLAKIGGGGGGSLPDINTNTSHGETVPRDSISVPSTPRSATAALVAENASLRKELNEARKDAAALRLLLSDAQQKGFVLDEVESIFITRN